MSFRSFFRFLYQRDVLIICFAHTTLFAAFGVFEILFPLYAKEYLLLTTSIIGILFAAKGLPNVLIRIPIGSLSDKIGRFKPFLFSLLLGLLALFLIPNMTNLVIIALLMGIYGTSWGARAPITPAFLADKIKSSDATIASSLTFLTANLGIVLGSFIAGSATLFLPLPTILKASPILVIPGILAILFFRAKQKIL